MYYRYGPEAIVSIQGRSCSIPAPIATEFDLRDGIWLYSIFPTNFYNLPLPFLILAPRHPQVARR